MSINSVSLDYREGLPFYLDTSKCSHTTGYLTFMSGGVNIFWASLEQVEDFCTRLQDSVRAARDAEAEALFVVGER